MKRYFIFILVGFLVLTLTSCRSFNKWFAKFQGDIDQEYKIQDADSRIYNYEWFYDQYGAIKSTAGKAKMLKGDDRTATILVLTDMIEKYNANASMSKTRGLWKSSDLPENIKLSDFIEEN